MVKVVESKFLSSGIGAGTAASELTGPSILVSWNEHWKGTPFILRRATRRLGRYEPGRYSNWFVSTNGSLAGQAVSDALVV